MRRRDFILSSLALASTPAWAQDAPVSIGFLAPLSGPYKSLGQQMVHAAQMAATEQKVTLCVEDTAGEPEGALDAVNRLLAKKVAVAVGPVGVRESVTAAGWTVRQGLPLISLCSDPTVLANPLTIRWRLSPAEQGAQLAGLVEGKTVAILAPDSDFGRGAAEGFRVAWTAAGREVAREAYYPEEKPDFRRALDEVTRTRRRIGVGETHQGKKADKLGYVSTGLSRLVDFDCLFIPDFHQRVSRILGFLPLVGIQNGEGGKGVAVQLLGLGGWRGRSMELTGAQAAGAIILDTYGGVDDGGRAEEFERAYESVAGHGATSFEAETFDAVWFAAEAARRQPDAPTAGMRALMPWTGVAGTMLRGKDGSLTRQGRLFRFDVDGRVVPVG
ncbi:MAG: penicillin-binding protein activator [bacterium]